MQKTLDRPPPNDPKKRTGGAHLELFTPDHAAVSYRTPGHPKVPQPRHRHTSQVLQRPLAMKMNKRPRNTDLVTLRVGVNCGADTAYEPSDSIRFHGNPHATPVRIGSCAGRDQKAATRFEAAFAIPGDFMPKKQPMED